jgi:hypothetical protein
MQPDGSEKLRNGYEGGKLLASVRAFGLIVFLIAALTWPAAAQTQPGVPSGAAPLAGKTNTLPEIEASAVQVLQLSPEAAQIAYQIAVSPLLKRLERLHGAPTADNSSLKLESLALRQEVTERVLSTSLDIDSVNAVIDLEVEHIRGIRADLQAKRDKAQNIINIASIFTGGIAGAITSALQFRPGTVNLGNGIGVGGGAGSVVLSMVGIRMKGGKRSLEDSPRMLARFFGRQPDAAEAIPSDYPEAVWAYLNSATPSQPQMATRREQLISKWRGEGRVKPDGSPKGERRIEAMRTNISQLRKLSINEMSDRVTMLLDVRASVSLMKRGLSEVLRGLSPAKSTQ